MGISIFLAKFWGGLFMILGALSIWGRLLGRTIEMTEERAITVSTGYITFLLGLVTVILHSVWVADWRVAITIVGWATLLKGILKIGFPNHVRKQAQLFKSHQRLSGSAIFLLGAGLFWASL